MLLDLVVRGSDIIPEVLKDDAHGMFASETIYSDLDTARLDSIPRTQPHREVDLMLVNADKEGTQLKAPKFTMKPSR